QRQRSLLETATTLSPAQPLALRSTRAASSASAAARLKVRSGEGGEDAEAFAKALVDAFSAWCRRHRVGFRRADEGRTFVLEVDPAAAGELARFAGVHRVQREPQGITKRHTSTATVAVISANAGLDAFDEEDVVWEGHRGGRKGGQHQNTTDSAVRSTHRTTGITVDISGRSQWQNRQAALAELRRRVNELAATLRYQETHRDRSPQIGAVPGRAEKNFTHNYQRVR